MSQGQDRGEQGAGRKDHQEYVRDPDEIGVLWRKTTANGGVWYSGIIDGRPVVVFWNSKKKTAKAPDYRVLLAKKKEESASHE